VHVLCAEGLLTARQVTYHNHGFNLSRVIFFSIGSGTKLKYYFFTSAKLMHSLQSKRKKSIKAFQLFNKIGTSEDHTSDSIIRTLSQVKLQELLLFDFAKLAIATNNFHSSNKLGQGGFGPVYKVL